MAVSVLARNEADSILDHRHNSSISSTLHMPGLPEPPNEGKSGKKSHNDSLGHSHHHHGHHSSHSLYGATRAHVSSSPAIVAPKPDKKRSISPLRVDTTASILSSVFLLLSSLLFFILFYLFFSCSDQFQRLMGGHSAEKGPEKPMDHTNDTPKRRKSYESDSESSTSLRERKKTTSQDSSPTKDSLDEDSKRMQKMRIGSSRSSQENSPERTSTEDFEVASSSTDGSIISPPKDKKKDDSDKKDRKVFGRPGMIPKWGFVSKKDRSSESAPTTPTGGTPNETPGATPSGTPTITPRAGLTGRGTEWDEGKERGRERLAGEIPMLKIDLSQPEPEMVCVVSSFATPLLYLVLSDPLALV